MAQAKLRNTTLVGYLDALHRLVNINISIADLESSTTGGTTSPENRLCPRRFSRVWNEVDDEHDGLFGARLFQNLHLLEGLGNDIKRRPISSEADLAHVTRTAIENSVAAILTEVSERTKLAEALQLKGTVKFENYANMLREAAEEREAESGFERKLAKDVGCRNVDQIIIQNVNGKPVPALIIEYKPPHKLSTQTTLTGLIPSHDVMNDYINYTHVGDDDHKGKKGGSCCPYLNL